MKHLLGIATLCLVGLATSASAQSRLEALDRIGENLGWEAVGRLDFPGGFCTGTLIAPDLVLTAAHCVVDPSGNPIPPYEMTFRAGYTRGKAKAERTAERVAVPRDYRPPRNGTLHMTEIPRDVALVRLSKPISSAEANPFAVHENPRQGDRVSVMSYGAGREDAVSQQRSCHVVSRYRGGLMAFDCEVTHGSSGSPVFIRYGTRARILSLISGGQNMGSDNTVSYGMELPALVAELKAQIGYSGSAVGASKGAKRITIGQRSTGTARFIRP